MKEDRKSLSGAEVLKKIDEKSKDVLAQFNQYPSIVPEKEIVLCDGEGALLLYFKSALERNLKKSDYDLSVCVRKPVNGDYSIHVDQYVDI